MIIQILCQEIEYKPNLIIQIWRGILDESVNGGRKKVRVCWWEWNGWDLLGWVGA